MRIKVTTPLGTYTSKNSTSKEALTDTEALIRNICEDGLRFSFDTETGTVFIPKEMIQKSVFEIIN